MRWPKIETEATELDLREILLDFWLGKMHDAGIPGSDQVKCSELVAKYFLADGRGAVRRSVRPPTREILAYAESLEAGRDGASDGPSDETE